jgi:hypothetical protein
LLGLARQNQTRLVDHTLSVFGTTYGLAPEKLVRQAARALQKEGRIQLDAKPKQVRDWRIWQ